MHISRQECPPNAQDNKHKQTYFNDILGHWGEEGKGHIQMIRSQNVIEARTQQGNIPKS